MKAWGTTTRKRSCVHALEGVLSAKNAPALNPWHSLQEDHGPDDACSQGTRACKHFSVTISVHEFAGAALLMRVLPIYDSAQARTAPVLEEQHKRHFSWAWHVRHWYRRQGGSEQQLMPGRWLTHSYRTWSSPPVGEQSISKVRSSLRGVSIRST